MSKLNDFTYLTDQYNIHVSNQNKKCFFDNARERFMTLFCINKNTIPQFFTLRNKPALFFYNVIMDKYLEIIKNINGMSYYKIYSCDKDTNRKVYIVMLDYYNNVIVPFLNKIKPSQIRNYIFYPLPNTFI